MSIGKVFISHKHRDKKIARVVADFLEQRSGKKVDVFLSSDSRFDSPRAGGNLDDELRAAIGDSGVVILIYTGLSDELDWSYCIYECAYATSIGIRLIVFQCSPEPPAPFQHKVRTVARQSDDVLKFTKDFMTRDDFFPSQGEKVTQYPRNDEAVAAAGKEFHTRLVAAINEGLSQKPQEWSAWKWMRLRLPGEFVKRVQIGEPAARLEQTKEAIRDTAVIVDSLSADQIFGVGIDRGQQVGHLLNAWQQARPKDDREWIDALCEQISACIVRQFPTLRDVRIREAMTLSSVIPVVTRTLTYPGDGSVELDIYFYDVHPVSPSVEDVMIPKDQMYFRTVGDGDYSNIPIQELFLEMQERSKHRLPILDDKGRIMHMIHRSMIGEFIAAATLNGANVAKLTLAALLDDSEKQSMFDSTFVFVPPRTTVEEARETLRDCPGARDVFVTANGTREEEVMGMLTNVDLDQRY